MTLPFFIMSATTFKKSGELDEDAQRHLFRRFIDSKLGLYLGSAGCGEGYALSHEELRRVYTIGVEEGRGKVRVEANIPEQHTAKEMIEHARIAIDSGIGVVHLYTLEGRHGMRPTEEELLTYFDDILTEIRHPVGIAVNPISGYIPRPEVMAAVCNKHRHVKSVRLTAVPDGYLIRVMDAVERDDVEYYVRLSGSLNALMTGRVGVFGTKASIIPKTFQRYRELFEAGKYKEMNEVYAQLMRFNDLVYGLGSGSPRWIKMAMKVLNMPGGEGGPRRPYLLPSDEELEKFRQKLLALDIPEVNELAKAGKRAA